MIGKTVGDSKAESASGSLVCGGGGSWNLEAVRVQALTAWLLPEPLHSALHAQRLRRTDADSPGQGHVPHSAKTVVQGVWSHGPFPSQQPGGSSQICQCVHYGACFKKILAFLVP